MDSLRQFRAEHRMKAKEVAEVLGFSVEHISRVENGKRNLSRAAWHQLRCHVEHRSNPDAD